MKPHQIEVSLVLAVSDAEDSIGVEIRGFAQHLMSLGRSFEIVAVNEGSCDNSLAVLRLLEQQVPQLRVIYRDVSGRAFARGIAEAQGQHVILATTANRPLSWAPLGWALGRLEAGHDAVVLRSRYVVARRLRCLPAVTRAAGSTACFERRFEREASSSLLVEAVGQRRATGLLTDLAQALRAPLRRFPLPLPRF